MEICGQATPIPLSVEVPVRAQLVPDWPKDVLVRVDYHLDLVVCVELSCVIIHGLICSVGLSKFSGLYS